MHEGPVREERGVERHETRCRANARDARGANAARSPPLRSRSATARSPPARRPTSPPAWRAWGVTPVYETTRGPTPRLSRSMSAGRGAGERGVCASVNSASTIGARREAPLPPASSSGTGSAKRAIACVRISLSHGGAVRRRCRRRLEGRDVALGESVTPSSTTASSRASRILLFELERELLAARLDDPPAGQDVHDVRLDMCEDPIVMRPRAPSRCRASQLVHVWATSSAVDVESGIGLVENCELRNRAPRAARIFVALSSPRPRSPRSRSGQIARVPADHLELS